MNRGPPIDGHFPLFRIPLKDCAMKSQGLIPFVICFELSMTLDYVNVELTLNEKVQM